MGRVGGLGGGGGGQYAVKLFVSFQIAHSFKIYKTVCKTSLKYFCVLKLYQSHVDSDETRSAFVRRDMRLLNCQDYSSLFMRHVCFSMCMVARSVELVKTSRTSSCRSSSVSASSARFFSCISICTHATHSRKVWWSDCSQSPLLVKVSKEQDAHKRQLNVKNYTTVVSNMRVEHVDHMWRVIKMGSVS